MNKFTHLVAAVTLCAGTAISTYAADPVTLPWSFTFNAANEDWAGKGWTVINPESGIPAWTPERNMHYPTVTTYTTPADNWMITPPLDFKAGKIYKISVESEIIEGTTYDIAIGTAPTAETMIRILNSFDGPVKYGSAPLVAGYIPEADGPAYIGIHVHENSTWVEKKFIGSNNIKLFEITEVGGIPQPVDAINLSTEFGSDKSVAINVKFNAPSLNEANLPLTSLDKIELYRGDELINTFTSPTAGSPLTFKDANLTNGGTYTYKVIASNAAGSAEATLSEPIWAGFFDNEFSQRFNTKEEFLKWSVVDNDGDGKTFSFSSSYGGYVGDKGTSGTTNDNWMISPAVYLSKGSTYQLSFSSNESKASDHFNAYVAAGSDIASLAAGTKIIDTDIANTPQTYSGTFSIEADGFYHVALQSAGTNPDKIHILDVTVVNGAAPAAPTGIELSIPESGKGTTITFTAPALNKIGTTLSSLDNIKIMRDGVEVANITDAEAGKQVTWTDPDDPADIVPYTITAYNASGNGYPAAIAVMAEPVTLAFDKEGCDKGWTVINANNDVYAFEFNDIYKAMVCGARRSTFDDWMISPSIYLPAGRVLKFTTALRTSSSTSYHNEVEILFGKNPSPEAMTETLMAKAEIAESSFKEYTAELKATESGFYNIGFHISSPEGQNGYGLLVQKFEIINGLIPLEPEIAVAGSELDFEPVITITTPTKTNTGADIDALDKIVLMRGDVEVKTLTEVAPGQTYTVTDKTITAPGYYDWTATVINAQGESQATAACAVGHYEVPFQSTFDASTDMREWSFDSSWRNKTDGGLSLIAYSSTEKGMIGTVTTPPIKLEAGKEYALTFLASDPESTNDSENKGSRFDCEVYVGHGNDYTAMTLIQETFRLKDTEELTSVAVTVNETGVYNFCICAINAYAAPGLFTSEFYLNDISVNIGRNLAAEIDLSAAEIIAGTESTVSVTVNNLGGLKAAEGQWSVDLFEGEELLATASGTELAPFSSTVITVPVRMSVFHGEELPLTAVVNYEGDVDLTDNTATASATLTMPTLPAPTDLTAEPRQERKATITWTAAETDGDVTYNIYRDGELLTAIAVTTYTDRAAGLGTHTYAVTALYADGESVATNPVEVEIVDQLDGIATIAAGSEDSVRWFDLQGREIRNPRPGSIAIRLTGTSAVKTVVPQTENR